MYYLLVPSGKTYLFVYLLFFYLSILPFIRALPDDFHTAPLILVVLLTYGSLQLSLVLINLTKGKSYVKYSACMIFFNLYFFKVIHGIVKLNQPFNLSWLCNSSFKNL